MSIVSRTAATAIRHRLLREIRFVSLLGVTLAVIALQLSDIQRLESSARSSWRKIDLGTLQRRIETGELSDHEALWYHPASPDESGSLRGAQ